MIYYSWNDIENACTNICLQMYKDNWRPDYIVGITKGGNVPATILCNTLGVRGEALKVSLRDDGSDMGPESNLWMAEDAFGYVSEFDRDGIFEKSHSDPANRKKILIVDDINDTGATFNWIKQDWQSGCLPDNPNWDTVWGQNVRFATICEKSHTECDFVNYVWKEIDTSEEDSWVVFPWEIVGK